jgi:CheY-like chemotaxis protein/HPt (histidine-containing phosphotransfer) domain-containing protein
VALRQLEKLGYAADAVADGREALEALATIPYDLVLMDCQMPVLDGYAAAAEIRRREAVSHARRTVIVAMTAHALEGERDRCLAAGMDDYLSKPVRPEALNEMLRRWSPDARAEPSGPRPALGARGVPPVDMARLMDVAGDAAELEELVGIYLRQMAEDVERLNAAVEAGRAEEVARIAHRCVGGSETCGMTSVIGPLRELERMGKEGQLEGARHLSVEVAEELNRLAAFLRDYSSSIPI